MTAAEDPGLAPTLPEALIGAPIVRPGLRAGLRRLGTGLITYGAVGIALSVIGLVALLYVGARLGGLGDRIGTQVSSIAETLDDTAAALSDAGASAVSFSSTLERTPPSVRQTATTVANLRADLLRVQADLGAIAILGSRPLGNVAELFGGMATDLEGLDGRLEAIATDLEDNRGRLIANGESLDAMGDRLESVATELRGSLVEDSLADIQVMVTVVAGLLLLWATLPAVGALVLGLWLRRELRPGRWTVRLRP